MSVPYNNYIQELKKQYSITASQWGLFNRNSGVGYFDDLNKYGDFRYLLNDIEHVRFKKILDFGCGPGRNIRNCQHIVGKIDGVELIHQYTEHACKYLHFCGYNPRDFTFYNTNGYDLSEIQDDTYDVIISSLVMQNICIYDIRYNYFKEFMRVLKPGGEISIQMGYGSPSPNTVAYTNNTWNDGDQLNGVCVENVSEIQNDLEEIGFINFTYNIVDTGPGDSSPKWIYFKASVPKEEVVQEVVQEV